MHTTLHTVQGPSRFIVCKCWQRLTKKEGDKGVKERSFQIDHIPKVDYFYFTKNDYGRSRALSMNLQKSKINSYLWVLTKVSRRNQVICSSFAFPGFVGTAQHSYDFQIQVVLAQRFFFHYCPGSERGLFFPLLVASRWRLLRTIVQMIHPCISFLHKRRDFAALL